MYYITRKSNLKADNYYYFSSFIGNVAPDNVILGAHLIPVILSGSNTFKDNQGSSIEVLQ